jgi:hypothetical protein
MNPKHVLNHVKLQVIRELQMGNYRHWFPQLAAYGSPAASGCFLMFPTRSGTWKEAGNESQGL